MDNISRINQVTLPRIQPLWILVMSYSVFIVLSNWFSLRIINLPFGLNVDAGTLIFPVSFVLADVITEVYGYKFARLAIWFGFAFNWFFIIFGQIIMQISGPEFADRTNAMFDELFSLNARLVIVASFCYIISEQLNSRILAKMKVKYNGDKMGLRMFFSTAVASFVDTFTFSFFGFYGVFPINELFILSFTCWAIKMLIELFGLPISISLAKRLKRFDQCDIYDTNTNFNIFKFDVHYDERGNRYKAHSTRD